jgi:hypothetical protein
MFIAFITCCYGLLGSRLTAIQQECESYKVRGFMQDTSNNFWGSMNLCASEASLLAIGSISAGIVIPGLCLLDAVPRTSSGSSWDRRGFQIMEAT